MNYASRTARRYATALTQLADEAGALEATVAELDQVARVYAETPELAAVLGHRSISPERKLALVQEVFGPTADEPGVSALTLSFLRLLIANRRTDLLPEVRSALEGIWDQRTGLVRATVTTAVPVVKAEKELMERKLRDLTGAQRVEIESRVTKTILGGVVIHVGGKVVDASLRTYLDTMRETLRRVKVSEFDQDGFLPLDADRFRPAGGAATE